jgi:hypothetical protein
MPADPEAYKIGVNIPPEFLDELLDAVNEVMEPLYPGYDRTFCYWLVKGTWRPLEGSDPYDGKVGEISVADETRVEFAVKKKDLERVLSVIAEVHPYEEPAVDVIPMIPWRSIIPSDGSRRRCRRSSASCGS